MTGKTVNGLYWTLYLENRILKDPKQWKDIRGTAPGGREGAGYTKKEKKQQDRERSGKNEKLQRYAAVSKHEGNRYAINFRRMK